MFINKSENNDYLIDYFNEFSDKLKKKTLNSFIKSVSSHQLKLNPAFPKYDLQKLRHYTN